MSRVVYARKSFEDIERLADFLIDVNRSAAWHTGKIIQDGISVLERHPLIGRPVEAGLRELVVSRGRSGYVALYRYDVARDEVMILALRHQRETGGD